MPSDAIFEKNVPVRAAFIQRRAFRRNYDKIVEQVVFGFLRPEGMEFSEK